MTPEPSTPAPLLISSFSDTSYSKELCLLSHVLTTALAGDKVSVYNAIEDFGKNLDSSGLWLKVAGGNKAEVLSAVVCREPLCGNILEIGTYCGYSAIRMAIVCPGVRIISLEVYPRHVLIKRPVCICMLDSYCRCVDRSTYSQ